MTTTAQVSSLQLYAPLESHAMEAVKIAICEQTQDYCLQKYGRRLRAIVLTGSLAREEATVVREAQRCHLQHPVYHGEKLARVDRL